MIFELRLDCSLRLRSENNSAHNQLTDQHSPSSTKTKTTLAFRLALFRRRRRRMAIAFYVPPEYGPARPAQQQQQQEAQGVGQPAPVIHQFQQQDANNNIMVGHAAAADVNQVPDNRDNLPGLDFAWRFIQEVLRACSIMSGNGGGSDSSARRVNGGGHDLAPDNRVHNAQSTRRRHPAGRVSRHHQQQDNQIEPQLEPLPTSPLADLIPRPFRSLPDIVTCHAGMSFRYGSSSHPDVVMNIAEEEEELEPSNDAHQRRELPVLPLTPTSSSPPANMDFELSWKLEMSMVHGGGGGGGGDEDGEGNNQDGDDVPGSLSPEEEFRLAGLRLRQIADSFERTRSNQNNQRRNQSSTFEVNVVISVAVPAVALIAIGLAYLRRS